MKEYEKKMVKNTLFWMCPLNFDITFDPILASICATHNTTLSHSQHNSLTLTHVHVVESSPIFFLGANQFLSRRKKNLDSSVLACPVSLCLVGWAAAIVLCVVLCCVNKNVNTRTNQPDKHG